LRTRVRSLECEVTQLRNLEPEVENLKKLLVDRDKELTESRRKETQAEEKSWELTAQLGEWSRESTELQARLNDLRLGAGFSRLVILSCGLICALLKRSKELPRKVSELLRISTKLLKKVRRF
jgi:hypothetical protein